MLERMRERTGGWYADGRRECRRGWLNEFGEARAQEAKSPSGFSLLLRAYPNIWARLRRQALASGSRRDEESMPTASATTNDAGLRCNRRRPGGFGRRREVCGVVPPRRAPSTPSSSRLASTTAALRTHQIQILGWALDKTYTRRGGVVLLYLLTPGGKTSRRRARTCFGAWSGFFWCS